MIDVFSTFFSFLHLLVPSCPLREGIPELTNKCISLSQQQQDKTLYGSWSSRALVSCRLFDKILQHDSLVSPLEILLYNKICRRSFVSFLVLCFCSACVLTLGSYRGQTLRALIIIFLTGVLYFLAVTGYTGPGLDDPIRNECPYGLHGNESPWHLWENRKSRVLYVSQEMKLFKTDGKANRETQPTLTITEFQWRVSSVKYVCVIWMCTFGVYIFYGRWDFLWVDVNLERGLWYLWATLSRNYHCGNSRECFEYLWGLR